MKKILKRTLGLLLIWGFATIILTNVGLNFVWSQIVIFGGIFGFFAIILFVIAVLWCFDVK